MQEGWQDEIVVLDGRVADLISEAVLAGAYAEVIRQQPETARGFGRLRDKHSDAVARLAAEIAEGAGRIGAAPDAR